MDVFAKMTCVWMEFSSRNKVESGHLRQSDVSQARTGNNSGIDGLTMLALLMKLFSATAEFNAKHTCVKTPPT